MLLLTSILKQKDVPADLTNFHTGTIGFDLSESRRNIVGTSALFGVVNIDNREKDFDENAFCPRGEHNPRPRFKLFSDYNPKP